VSALLGVGSEGRVAEAIERLCAAEVLGRKANARFSGECEYVFRHAILGDVAYEALTDEDRVLGHRLAGRWLDGRPGVEPLLLAAHFEKGQELARAA
jgi:eukaryotic-like serine/threonine-protein kinase